MKTILGIDIGTTSVCAVLLSPESGETLKSVTLPNESELTPQFPFEKAQSPEKILETVKNAVTALGKSDICAVGVTGQMHGILYLDKDNKPCSPLYTWQDGRGNEKFSPSATYAEHLSALTKIKAASGFGLITHFYNKENGLVPKNAAKLSTIHDYTVSVITNTAPVTHTSDAASLGFFDLEALDFDSAALKKAGIDRAFLPTVKKDAETAGVTSGCEFLKDGIPVCVALGDNQASFLGSVKSPETSLLVNVGTGSQVSFVTNKKTAPSSGEIRPLYNDKYLFVGSSLCGGRAYGILKDFFLMCSKAFGFEAKDLYKKMDELALSAKETDGGGLFVNCEFCGTREKPEKRGAILNISDKNFTPQNLALGVLKGVADELFNMYCEAKPLLDAKPLFLIGSGNGIRKSELWQRIFEKKFGMKLFIPKNTEEASTGACIFAAAASGLFKSVEDAQKSLLK